MNTPGLEFNTLIELEYHGCMWSLGCCKRLWMLCLLVTSKDWRETGKPVLAEYIVSPVILSVCKYLLFLNWELWLLKFILSLTRNYTNFLSSILVNTLDFKVSTYFCCLELLFAFQFPASEKCLYFYFPVFSIYGFMLVRFVRNIIRIFLPSSSYLSHLSFETFRELIIPYSFFFCSNISLALFRL